MLELATITKRQFLTDLALVEVQKKCRNLNTIPAVLHSNLPTLGAIVRKFGDDFTQAYLEGWIVNLREFINVGKKMNDIQTHETAMLILQEYPSLNIADINLIFKRAKLGKFGEVYDRLDGQLILGWLEKYFNERCAAAAMLSIQEAESLKGESRSISFEQAVKLAEKKTYK